MGQNAKAPSKIVFDDCDMETPWGNAPVTIANSTLFDVEFHNFRVKEANRDNRKAWPNPPVRIELNREYRYYFNWKDWDVANEGSLLFDNFTVEGYDGAALTLAQPCLRSKKEKDGRAGRRFPGLPSLSCRPARMNNRHGRAAE